jgi:hypothetical protein
MEILNPYPHHLLPVTPASLPYNLSTVTFTRRPYHPHLPRHPYNHHPIHKTPRPTCHRFRNLPRPLHSIHQIHLHSDSARHPMYR